MRKEISEKLERIPKLRNELDDTIESMLDLLEGYFDKDKFEILEECLTLADFIEPVGNISSMTIESIEKCLEEED